MRALLLLVLAAGDNASPVHRVVELLGDLKSKLIADGKAEQALYDKYACWCEETTARKASAIEEGKAQIEELSKNILGLSAANGVSTATLAKLKKDIAENKESTAAAESLRAKEKAAYTKNKGELEQNKDNVEKAINTLAKGTSGFTPAMVETQTLTIAAGVRSALKSYESTTKEDLAPVRTFLADPAAWVQTKAAPHLQKYNTQSNVIQGILKEMFDTFERELASSKEEEETKASDFSDLMGTKKTELKLLQASLVQQTTKEADDGKDNADDKVEREQAQAKLRTDEDFFNTMKQGCKDEANSWAENSRVRTEELSGISQATEILTSDDGAFDRADATFVQLKSSGARDWAYTQLKKAAKAGKSVQLAVLAARVKATGHFDEVLGEIDSMIRVLREEQDDDVAHRDQCNREKHNNEAKNEALSYEMTELENKGARLQSQKDQKQALIAAAETDQAKLQGQMDDALSQRNETRTLFKQAMADDAKSVELLQQAVDKLGEFYAKEALLAQQKQVKKVAAAPEGTAVEDSAPESVNAKKGSYGGRQSEGGGIIQILEMIKQDLQKDMTLAQDAESESLSEYTRLYSESMASMEAMDAQKAELARVSAELDSKMAGTENVRLDKEAVHNSTTDYLDSISGECGAVLANFEDRRGQRKDEMSGLQNAKSILLGAGYEEQTGGTLVAVRSTPSKQAQASGKPHKETVDEELADLDADAATYTAFLQRH